MKMILAVTGLSLVLGGASLWNAFRTPTTFGAFVEAPTVEVSALLERPKEFLSKTVAIEGRVTEQCKAMGCFFAIPAKQGKLRVDLQDIAMTAPRHEGGQARVEGQLVPYGDGYQFYATAVEFK